MFFGIDARERGIRERRLAEALEVSNRKIFRKFATLLHGRSFTPCHHVSGEKSGAFQWLREWD
jgi:predicted DNA-binding transcriptional regulator YafY